MRTHLPSRQLARREVSPTTELSAEIIVSYTCIVLATVSLYLSKALDNLMLLQLDSNQIGDNSVSALADMPVKEECGASKQDDL